MDFEKLQEDIERYRALCRKRDALKQMQQTLMETKQRLQEDWQKQIAKA